MEMVKFSTCAVTAVKEVTIARATNQALII